MKKEDFKEKFIKLNRQKTKEQELYFDGYYDITDYIKVLEYQLSDLTDLVNKYLFEE